MKSIFLFLILIPFFSIAEETLDSKNYTEPQTGLIFPHHIDSYTQTGVMQYSDKKDGVRITYSGYGHAQFFVYDAGFKKIATGVKSEEFKKAFQTSASGLNNVLTSDAYSNGEVFLTSTPNIKMENKEANLEVVMFTSTFNPEPGANIPITSWLLMTGYKNKLLKLLFTHKGNDMEKSQEELKALISGLLSANPEGIKYFFVEQKAP